VSHEGRVLDVLDLIGRTIERLRASVDLFEAERREDGVTELSAAVQEIDAYLRAVDDGPLVPGGPTRRAALVRHLEGVKTELAAVIASAPPSAPSSHA
jgi:hypothetical protein